MLVALLLLAVASGIVALAREGVWLEVHVAIDAVTILYAISLREAKRRRHERSRKVRSIAARRRRRLRTDNEERLQAAGARPG